MASVELPDFVEVGKDWYGKPKYYYFPAQRAALAPAGLAFV
jgi:hypothetical protein